MPFHGFLSDRRQKSCSTFCANKHQLENANMSIPHTECTTSPPSFDPVNYTVEEKQNKSSKAGAAESKALLSPLDVMQRCSEIHSRAVNVANFLNHNSLFKKRNKIKKVEHHQKTKIYLKMP